MRINEIIQPDIDKDLLLIESLRHSITNIIISILKDNKVRTKNYSIDAVDVFSFPDLNDLIILINQLKNNVLDDIGEDSETYKIIDFLENYFRY